MTNLPTTYIGTSQPVDICHGFAMFPTVGKVTAGVSVQTKPLSIFETSATLLAFRVYALAKGSLFFGVCGPAYGFGFETSGNITGDKITLGFEGDNAQGGVLTGLVFGVLIRVQVDLWTIHWVWDGWHSPIKTSWDSLGSININIGLDVIDLIASVLLLILDEDKNNPVLQSVLPNLASNLSTWGFYDVMANTLARSGEIKVAPTFIIPIDLAAYFAPLRAANEVLKCLWGGISFGPQIGISMPIRATIKSVSVNNVKFGNITFSDNKLHGTGGSEVADPKTMTMEFEHEPFFDFQIGFFAHLSVCKFVNIGFQISVPVGEALGIYIGTGGPYTNTLTANLGVGADGGVMKGAANIPDNSRGRVILAPPAVAV